MLLNRDIGVGQQAGDSLLAMESPAREAVLEAVWLVPKDQPVQYRTWKRWPSRSSRRTPGARAVRHAVARSCEEGFCRRAAAGVAIITFGDIKALRHDGGNTWVCR